MKHRLLRVVRRLFQYQVLLTDYLNNLCPDSAEYDNTQGALTLISKVTDRANDSMEQGENLQKLVHMEHSVRGQGDLLQPGREFLKEGTLMKVTGKNRCPRHLFLMSDVLLYTYPQKDGRYRLKSTLAVASMKVRPWGGGPGGAAAGALGMRRHSPPCGTHSPRTRRTPACELPQDSVVGSSGRVGVREGCPEWVMFG